MVEARVLGAGEGGGLLGLGLQGVQRRNLKGREAASACGSEAAGGVPSTDSVAESRSNRMGVRCGYGSCGVRVSACAQWVCSGGLGVD